MEPPAPEGSHRDPIPLFALDWSDLAPLATSGTAAPYRWERVSGRIRAALRSSRDAALFVVPFVIATHLLVNAYGARTSASYGQMKVAGLDPNLMLVTVYAGLMATWLIIGGIQIVATVLTGRRLGLSKVPRTPREHLRESGTAIMFLALVQLLVLRILVVPLPAAVDNATLVTMWSFVAAVVGTALVMVIWVPVHALVLFEGMSAGRAVLEAVRISRFCRGKLVLPSILISTLLSAPRLSMELRFGLPGTSLDPVGYLTVVAQGAGLVLASAVGVSLVAEYRRSQREYEQALREAIDHPPTQAAA